MIVMPASRMLSAISFGVFCRSAPSTSAIMRSRKVEPGSAVIRTLIQSEITCVPPVTAERSPPLSRITGADSPVMAASLTEATPSITSPSHGIRSPVCTSTMSPLRSLRRGHLCPFRRAEASASRLATVSVLALRRVSACALPRPSATASAKLANSTVNQSQRLICRAKPQPPWPVDEVADEQDRGERRHDLDHEHDRVSDHASAGRACGRRVDDRGPEDLRIDAKRGEPARLGMAWCMLPLRRACRRSSTSARRWGRAPAPGRR